jgi:hypothetical protein
MYIDRLIPYLINKNGHSIDEKGIHLISIADITELERLAKLRAQYKNDLIIAGGHLSKNAPIAMSLFADYVNIGHGYDFFKLKKEDLIRQQPYIYYNSKKEITISNQNVNWVESPILQTDKNRYYLFGGTGCKNKCQFCLTSWTENHNIRPKVKEIVNIAKRKIGKRDTIKIISNEYGLDVGDDLVQDMMLMDYVNSKSYDTKRKKIRCGVEFATESTRAKYGKPMPNDAIKYAIKKAEIENHELQLFLIGGINTIDEWDSFFDSVIPESNKLSPKVYFKFTNIEFQQKTPLFKQFERFDINNYIDSTFINKISREHLYRNKRIRFYPVKYPAHSLWRMYMSNIKNYDEYEWGIKHKNEKDVNVIYSQIINNNMHKLDLSNIKTSVPEMRRAL